MFVELIEQLRCPRDHAESALVVATSHTTDRYIARGVLGCPACGTEYRIEDGVARFGAAARPTPPQRPAAGVAMRLAAFLDLTDARGFAVLSGGWCSQLDEIQKLAETPLVLVNPPVGVGGQPAGVLLCGDAAPVAAGSMRAVALDGELPPELRASLLRAVRSGGRVVGPTLLAVPEDVSELDRDDELWVGEKVSPLSQLRRGPPRTASR